MFVIPQDLAQAILDYLASRPYREVHELIVRLQRLERLAPPASVEPDGG